MSKRFLRTTPIITGALSTWVALLAGCSSGDNPASATSSYNAKARKALSAKTAHREGDVKDMVAAASATKNGAPVEVRFTLLQKPEVGQPLDLAVALVPKAPGLESVAVTFTGAAGLDVVEGAQAGPAEKPVEGTPLRFHVKLLPKQDGIFAVTAMVSVLTASETVTRSFSIPVIAGTGLPELATKPEVQKGS